MVIPHSSSGRRHAPRRARAAGLVAALVALAVAVAACEDQREETPDTSGLLVLAGDVGAVGLTVRDAAAPAGRPLDLPDPGTTWVAAGRAHVLVATLLDGRTFVSRPIGDGAEARWRPVEAVGVDEEPVPGPLHFGVWNPPGGAYALIGSDFVEGSGLRVVVVDPALEGASVAELSGETATAAPPAWLDEDRVAVVVGGATGGATRIVDTTTGNAFEGPADVALLATSADTSTAALWRGTGAVEVLPTETWLRGERGSIRIDPPSGAARPGVLALDATGERLATLWLDEAGGAVSIGIHEARAEWAETTSIEVDAPTASVAWLR